MENIFSKFRPLLLKHVSEKSITELEKLWNDKTRFYHNVSHLKTIISEIQYNIWFGSLSLVEKHTLLLGAFFHDAIYDPKRKDNEDKSIEFFKKSYIGKDEMMIEKVCGLIEVTKHRKRPIEKLQKILWDADNAGFSKGYEHLLKNEKLIQKEYSFVTHNVYKDSRIKFLKTNLGLFDEKVDKDINHLIEYVNKL